MRPSRDEIDLSIVCVYESMINITVGSSLMSPSWQSRLLCLVDFLSRILSRDNILIQIKLLVHPVGQRVSLVRCSLLFIFFEVNITLLIR